MTDQKTDKEYRCGVIVNKKGKKVCSKPATHVVNIADPDDPTHTKIAAICLVCDRHSELLDEGKALLFKSMNKVWQVQFSPSKD